MKRYFLIGFILLAGLSLTVGLTQAAPSGPKHTGPPDYKFHLHNDPYSFSLPCGEFDVIDTGYAFVEIRGWVDEDGAPLLEMATWHIDFTATNSTDSSKFFEGHLATTLVYDFTVPSVTMTGLRVSRKKDGGGLIIDDAGRVVVLGLNPFVGGTDFVAGQWEHVTNNVLDILTGYCDLLGD